MKQTKFSALLLGLFATMLVSCSKTMSTDPPLIKSRQQAVFVQTENSNLISYHAETGNKLWEVSTKGVCDVTPAFYDQTVYTISNTGNMYAVDVIEGKVKWTQSTGVLMAKGITVPLLVSPSQAPFTAILVAADKLYCYNTIDGGLVWTYDGGGPCTSTAQLTGARAYVAVGTQIHCVDLLTGNGVWQSAGTPAPIESSVRMSNATIYFGCTDGKLYAINESNGAPKWNYTTGDKVQSSPVVYGGMCVVGSNDYSIHCIDTTTGLKRWVYPTKERVISSPMFHPGTESVLVGSYDFNLYCIDHVSGKLRWKYPSASLIKSSPLVMGNMVYFTSYDRYLYCVNMLNGALLWKQFLNGNTQASVIGDDLKDGVHPSDSGNSNN